MLIMYPDVTIEVPQLVPITNPRVFHMTEGLGYGEKYIFIDWYFRPVRIQSPREVKNG